MWSLLFEFVIKLLSGEVWHVWKEHKTWEAIKSQNDIAGLSADDVAKRLQQWTKPN